MKTKDYLIRKIRLFKKKQGGFFKCVKSETNKRKKGGISNIARKKSPAAEGELLINGVVRLYLKHHQILILIFKRIYIKPCTHDEGFNINIIFSFSSWCCLIAYNDCAVMLPE